MLNSLHKLAQPFPFLIKLGPHLSKLHELHGLIALGETWVDMAYLPSLFWSLEFASCHWSTSDVIAISGVIVGGNGSVLNVEALPCRVVAIEVEVRIRISGGVEVWELPPLLLCQLLPEHVECVSSWAECSRPKYS